GVPSPSTGKPIVPDPRPANQPPRFQRALEPQISTLGLLILDVRRARLKEIAPCSMVSLSWPLKNRPKPPQNVPVPAVVESAHAVVNEARREDGSVGFPERKGPVRGILVFVVGPAVGVGVGEGDREE
ncbi:hypothetical protein MMC29_007079, partial [Sticta canariensis]|nr:hypothetical protein [Sticta canariensis]